MKVFVTGATGFVGQEIVRRLHDAGYAIRILVRRKPLLRVDGFRGAMDAEIHVGIISEFRQNTFENVHLMGTRNVVTAARDQGVKRFIHMSALGTRPNSVSRYHQTKWEAEEIVRGSGLDFTIFRPSLIFGPRDMFVNTFAKIIRFSPIVPILGRQDARFQPVAIDTVASAFVKALAEEK